MTALRRGLEQVALGADEDLRRDHQFLANRVDRRVGDLSEELLEVAVEELGLVRQHGRGRVVAHGAERLDAVPGHRSHQHLQLLGGVPEHPLMLDQPGGIAPWDVLRLWVGDVLQPHLVLVQPVAVGVRGCQVVLDLLVADDAPCAGVDEEHLARFEAALVGHLLWRHLEHAHLGGHHEQVVGGDVVAGRTQAVPVEHGADHDAVGEAHRRRAVPGLHQVGVVLVVRPLLVLHVLVTRPGFGDHHRHDVRQRPPGQEQELEAVVEHRRIAAIRMHDRQDLLDVAAEELGFEHVLLRAQPVDVAAQGVDLAVVHDVPVRMGEFPARESVGAEPRVDQRERRFQVWLGEIAEVALQLVGDEHPLVDQRLVRQAGDVEELAAFERAAVADFVLRALADDVEPALEGQVVHDARTPCDEDHPHLGFRPPGRLAERPIVDLDRPPPDDALPFGGDDLLEVDLDRAPVVDIRRQEDHPDTVVAGPRQAVAVAIRLPVQEGVRHLDQDPRAVSGVGLCPARAPVSQVGQDGQRVANDLVRPLPADIDHHPEAAGVVLEAGVGTGLACVAAPGVADGVQPSSVSWSSPFILGSKKNPPTGCKA